MSRAVSDSRTGFDRAPERYSAKGRETIDRMRDAVPALFQYAWECGATGEDACFYVHCKITAMKYADRLGLKDEIATDAEKICWYEAMALHVLGLGADPRAERTDFVPYCAQAPE